MNQPLFGCQTEKLDDIAGQLSFFNEVEANYNGTMYIVFDSRPCFPDVGILRKVGFLIFEATKKYYPEAEKWLE